MAKDAKGHGSEKRGGGSAAGDILARLGVRGPVANAAVRAAHTQGVSKIGQPAPDIKSTIYNFARKMPGYNGRVTPLNADYSTSGRMLRSTMSPLGAGMTKEDHKSAGDAHIQQAMAMNAQHRDLVDKAMGKLGMQSPGPLISGIVSDKFSEGDKNKLRDLAVGASKHTSAAFAHYAASGMRLDTARGRYQGLKG